MCYQTFQKYSRQENALKLNFLLINLNFRKSSSPAFTCCLLIGCWWEQPINRWWTGVSNKVAPEYVALTLPLLVYVGSMSATSWWKFMGLNVLWKMCWTWTPARRKSSVDILSSCYKTQLLKTTSMLVCRASDGDHKMGGFLWLLIWYLLLLSFR